jgi:hypothetical protein
MNEYINSNLRIVWILTLDGGEMIHDNVQKPGEISVWRKTQESLTDRPKNIRLAIISENRVVKEVIMGESSSHFFFSRRSRLTLGEHASKEEYGIGYHDGQSNTVRITWYDENLDPVELDIREFEKCQQTLIPKISTASSFQS